MVYEYFSAGMLSGTILLYFFSGLCAFVGALSSRTSTALVAAYGSGLAVGLGLPILALILAGGMSDAVIYFLSMVAPFIGSALIVHKFDVLPAWLFGLAVYAAFGRILFRQTVQIYLAGADSVASLLTGEPDRPPIAPEPRP